MGNGAANACRGAILAVTLAFSVAYAFFADAQVFSADAVKAAFLHRFASYVEWPPEEGAEGSFVIAVAGSEEVSNHLAELLPGITVQGRRAELRRITRATELDGVHILYVGSGMLPRTRELRSAAMERPILLVTDGDDGFEGGAVINFVEEPTRVRFEISLPAADRARLRIDSALLQVAARVQREPQASLRSGDPFTGRYFESQCLVSRARVEARSGS